MKTSQIFLAFLLAAAFSIVTSGCEQLNPCVNPSNTNEEQTLSVNDFSAIHLKGSGEVFLTYGDTESVVVKAPQEVLDRLDVSVNSGILLLDVDGCFSGNFDLEYYVTIAQPVKELSVSGSGDIFGQNEIEAATDLTLDISGSGLMSLEVAATNISSRISGSGELSLIGIATSHDARISGSGDLYAFDLKTIDNDIQVSGSGDAEIFSEGGTLDVKISGAGTVYYKGTPASINTQVTGSGDLIDAN
ncbi:MAG: head GIN domain-containing protein [Bacteroidota bacterium]